MPRGIKPANGFKKGQKRPAGAGRKPGQANKTTQILKDALLMAADEVGRVEEHVVKKGKSFITVRRPTGIGGLVAYLAWAAVHHPASFMSLLGRVLPLQVKVDASKTVVYRSVEEISRGIAERKLPLQCIASMLLDLSKNGNGHVIEVDDDEHAEQEKDSDAV